jgi:hypothetical protein
MNYLTDGKERKVIYDIIIRFAKLRSGIGGCSTPSGAALRLSLPWLTC